MSSTVYDIALRYTTQDRASAGLAKISRQADRVGSSLGQVKALLLALGTGFAARAGIKALVGYNSELEQSKLSMATIISMQLHKPFATARREAEGLVTALQEVAKKSPATTKDFVEMATALAPTVAMFGGGVGKLQKLAEGGVIAGLATKTRADVAALDIQQMLMGSVTVRDRMATQILASIGLDKEVFNKKGGGERAKIVESLLQSSALKTGADAMGKSTKGVFSTLQDQLQIAFGKAGAALTASLTKEVAAINAWFEKNPVAIQNMINGVSSALRSGFVFVRDVAGFMVAHRDELLALAKAFVVFKGLKFGMGALAGIGGSVAGAVSGLLNGFRSAGAAGASLGARLSSAAGIAGTFGAALGAAAVAFFSWKRSQINADQNRRIATGATAYDLSRMSSAAGNQKVSAAQGALSAARTDGTLSGTTINENRLRQSAYNALPENQRRFIGDWRDKNVVVLNQAVLTMRGNLLEALRLEQTGAISAFQALRETAERASAETQAALDRLFSPVAWLMGKTPPEEWKDLAGDKKVEQNITVQIEVASEDPDRFVFGLSRAFDLAAKAPTQARAALTGGR